MLNTIKIKHFFGPIAIILISSLIIPMLSRIQDDSNNTGIVMVVFYSLFMYWFAALAFTIRGFMKNRIPTGRP